MRAAAKPAATAAAELIDAYFQSTTGGESRPLHDPCVMLYALEPGLFGCEPFGLRVDTGDTRDAGALTVDAGAAAISVAMIVDAPGALDLLRQRLVS